MESNISENSLVLPPSSSSSSSSSSTSPSSALPEKTLNFYDISHLEETNLPEPTPCFSSRVYFRDYIKPPIIGAGLSNKGNSCFINSVLQCLMHTVSLLQRIMSCDHPYPCGERDGFCVICTLIDHINVSFLSPGGVVSPDGFVDNISNISSLFQKYQQEDAHEFFQCLLDKLDSCCSQVDSFVKQTFGGRLKSQLRCCNCDCSDTFEPLIDLSLEIEDVDTLQDALKSFTRVEKLEDSEMKFTCEKCQKVVVLEKQFTLDRAPSVATFHLKRFKSDGCFAYKNDKYVQYPLEMDLQPYTSSSKSFDVELKYELYAVVVHIGLSTSSGHYICYIRSSPKTWYMMNDSKVVRVSTDYVLSQEAYMLLYARRGTPWFVNFYKELQRSNGAPSSPTSVLDNPSP